MTSPQHSRLNNPESCVVCGRRADGLAVGSPQKLGWYCDECTSDRAKEVMKMAPKQFDIIEQRACKKVAELAGLTEFTLTADELPGFIQWAVDEFAKAVRDEVKGGKPPF